MKLGRVVPHPVLNAETQLGWSGGAMTPMGLAKVCAEVADRKQPRVVECGSGYSTIMLARTLQARGGCLVSLEHDPLRARRVRNGLVENGLAAVATVVLAPLEAHPLGANGLQWYAEDALGAVVEGIDVLVVDGPPAFTPATAWSRYPALPALRRQLTMDATVLLDDIDRDGELEVLEAWERGSDFRFKVLPYERIAVGRSC